MTVSEPVIVPLPLTDNEPVKEWWSLASSPKLFEPEAIVIDDDMNVVWISVAVIVPVEFISLNVTFESVLTGWPRLAVMAAILAVAKVMLSLILLTLDVIAAILAEDY